MTKTAWFAMSLLWFKFLGIIVLSVYTGISGRQFFHDNFFRFSFLGQFIGFPLEITSVNGSLTIHKISHPGKVSLRHPKVCFKRQDHAGIAGKTKCLRNISLSPLVQNWKGFENMYIILSCKIVDSDWLRDNW